MKNKKTAVVHPIPPLYDENSRVLILGSFPSVKSREDGFFYGHKQNRFWKVVSSVLGEKTPQTIAEKKSMLIRNRIALWDVIQSCEIVGSSDSSIKNVVPNDIGMILRNAPIEKIFVNGKKAEQMYKKYIEPATDIKATVLPSTSPANAAISLEELKEKWKTIIQQR